jgi:hypothetical protein
LNLRQVPGAVGLAPDPAGPLGTPHCGLAHPDPAGKLTVAGRPPIHAQTWEVKLLVSELGRLSSLLFSRQRAFIGSSKLPMRGIKMIPELQKQIAKSREQALAVFVSKKAEIDAMLTRLKALSDDHFNYGPDDISWDHVCALDHYAELLKRVTDSVFREGECAE